jgi:hypothetical protein
MSMDAGKPRWTQSGLIALFLIFLSVFGLVGLPNGGEGGKQLA